MNGILR